MLPGTPREFIQQVHSYSARKDDESKDAERAAIEMGDSWSLDSEVWDRSWSALSGGEAQRAALAVACTLKGTEVLLLDGKLIKTIRLCYLWLTRYARTHFCARCKHDEDR